jgi:hypothetical protein
LIPRIWTARSPIARECRQTLLERRGPATASSISALTGAAVVSAPRINHHCRARPDTGCKREHCYDDETYLFENSHERLLAPCFFRAVRLSAFPTSRTVQSASAALCGRSPAFLCSSVRAHVGRLSAKRAIRQWVARPACACCRASSAGRVGAWGSLDDLVGAGEQLRRDCDSRRPSGF